MKYLNLKCNITHKCNRHSMLFLNESSFLCIFRKKAICLCSVTPSWSDGFWLALKTQPTTPLWYARKLTEMSILNGDIEAKNWTWIYRLTWAMCLKNNRLFVLFTTDITERENRGAGVTCLWSHSTTCLLLTAKKDMHFKTHPHKTVHNLI